MNPSTRFPWLPKRWQAWCACRKRPAGWCGLTAGGAPDLTNMARFVVRGNPRGRNQRTRCRRPLPPRLPAWSWRTRPPADGPLPRPLAPALLAAEIDALPGDCLLAALGDLEVWLAGSDAIPNILREIGHLRELTCREAGKRTGRVLAHEGCGTGYRHVVLWNAATREIAGACRMGLSDELLGQRGRDGSHPHGMLRVAPGVLRGFGCCLELASSFVIPAYQSNPHSLILLWKGIGHFIARNPRYRTLLGQAGSSSDRAMASRSLMAGLRCHWVNFNAAAPRLEAASCHAAAPDALVAVDLLAADPRLMARFMGAAGWQGFCETQHALGPKPGGNPAPTD